MKVLLIGNLAEDRQESMLRFTAILQSGLEARGHTVVVVAPTLRLARRGLRYHYAGLPKYLGYFDKFVLFPRELRKRIASVRPDVIHIADHSNAVYASVAGGVPVVAPCHDLLQVRAARGEFPRQKVGLFGRRYQAWIQSSLTRVDRVACISTKTRTDVLRLTGIPSERVVLVSNALNYPYRRIPANESWARLTDLLARNGVAPATLGSSEAGFLLHVGAAHWYKNRQGLIRIYAHLRNALSPAPRLVMVGPALAHDNAAVATQLGIADSIVSIPAASNLELEALYSLAEALVFPSWEEGFGWPIVEAQACGCPVFVSRRSPMTEVAGTHAGYFDPENPPAAAQIIAAAWPARSSLAARALADSKRWQPVRMLAEYEDLYRELIH